MSDDSTPGPPWTILKLLRWTTGFFEDKGIDTARLDAELLLSEVLDIERIQLYAQFDRPVDDNDLADFRALIKRRSDREPVAYILGRREFWSMDFEVDERVLVPRPDTETLVLACLDRIEEDSSQRLVDIGTGSGAVAIALASERPDLQIAATDNSAGALEVAGANAERLLPERTLSLFEGDLFDALPDDWRSLDFVVSNPPYVAEEERDEMDLDVLEFEPSAALFAGPDGLEIIRRLVSDATTVLRPGGWLLFEIGYQQGPAARELLAEQDYEEIEIRQDFGDRDRVAIGRRPTD